MILMKHSRLWNDSIDNGALRHEDFPENSRFGNENMNAENKKNEWENIWKSLKYNDMARPKDGGA